MSTVTSVELRDLATWSTGPCVSLYLPIDPQHPDVEAARTSLRSLTREARMGLDGAALRRPDVEALLEPMETLIASEHWPLSQPALVFFTAPGRSTTLALDVAVPARAFVADRFVVTPLVGAVQGDEHYFVLALSQKRVQLYRGDRAALVEVDVPDMPTSRADARWFEAHERSITVHGGSHQGTDRIVGTIHGSPSDRDLRKEQVRRFLVDVEQAVRRALHLEKAPLLVAGVDYELAMYRDVNRYPHLDANVVTGNPDRLDARGLHSLVWPVARERLDAPRRKLLERLQAAVIPLTDPTDVLAACAEGNVEALFVDPSRVVWGALPVVEVHDERQPGDVELTSVVIGGALVQGAVVHPAHQGELPEGTALAALVRY